MTHFYDRDVYKFAGVLDSQVPSIALAWETFNAEVFDPQDRQIPLRYRELMAIAVSLTTQCPYCIETHTKRAIAAGATETELAETAWVTTAIRGGAGYAHGALMTRLVHGHDSTAESPDEEV